MIKEFFNYKAVYDEIVLDVKEFLSKPKDEEKKLEKPKFVLKENSIEIPKIKIQSPLLFITGNQANDYLPVLEKGVVKYTESAFPGQKGQTVILGHSAPSGWQNKYEAIFSDLNDLIRGDEIFVYYDFREYRYKVTEKIILPKGDEIPTTDLDQELILVSCWPPGINNKRIAVRAEPDFRY